MDETAKERRAASRLAADRVSYLTVGPDGAGQRLDNFLLRLAKGVPQSHVYRIVRSGQVRVNKARASVDRRLVEGDRIRVPPLRLAAAPPPPVRAQMPPVLFEDEHLIVVDKPAGLAAHGGSGIAHGLIEMVRAARPNQPFLELAHRLDRETSGILLLAKTRRALLGLHEQLREGQVDKRYLALVAGDWVNDRQHLAAHTVFNLRHRYGPFSLLEAELKTGRTHQIRVHLGHVGFPIVGDGKYGDFELNRRVARGEFGVPLRRMFLHACATRFVHPVSGVPMAIESALDRECSDFLRGLGRA
ncbi:MAG: pseudouridylate synthase [Burkholderiaceae bacterium]|nr:pseudouridylate synthase [Burkholderiaceae bacterium]